MSDCVAVLALEIRICALVEKEFHEICSFELDGVVERCVAIFVFVVDVLGVESAYELV